MLPHIHLKDKELDKRTYRNLEHLLMMTAMMSFFLLNAMRMLPHSVLIASLR